MSGAEALRRPPRDTRLDLLRGWLQLQIFASHAHGSFIGAWLISAAWGLSDSSEQFVYLSGFVLGSVYTLKARKGGWGAGLRDLLPRIRRLWATHMVVVCSMAAMVIAVEMTLHLPGEARRLGWGWLLDAPWFALPGAATMLWQPTEMGILPVFVWSMLLLPGFLWLADRIGAWALAPSLALYLAVHLWGWELPGLGGLVVEFNPLAWQVLFILGAWFGRRALLHGQAARHDRWLLAGALLVLAAGAVAKLGAHLAWWSLGDWDDKQHLAPLRILHALSLAYAVVAIWRVREMALRGVLARGLAAAGQKSLYVFCVGLFLSYGIEVLFVLQGWRLWIEGLVVLGAFLLLIYASAGEWTEALTRRLKNSQK
ncbi:OpgC family protein [Paracraurococcus ruber]|nr:OpgC domain-containing protein [Paracraurococcus ruber]